MSVDTVLQHSRGWTIKLAGIDDDSFLNIRPFFLNAYRIYPSFCAQECFSFTKNPDFF